MYVKCFETLGQMTRHSFNCTECCSVVILRSFPLAN